jgi:RNA polymerase sigma-70 factor (ECF subfamily)
MIQNALARLAPRRRAILVLHEIEGLSVRSIATMLGVTAVTVRWHLSVGRREMAGILGAGGRS